MNALKKLLCHGLVNPINYKVLLHTKYVLCMNTDFMGDVNKYK